MKKYEIPVSPVDSSILEDGTFFYDFGRHAFAILELELESEQRQQIVIAVGEVRKNGRLDRNPGGSRIYQEQTVDIMPGHQRVAMKMLHPGYNNGTLTIEPNAVPFRYAELRSFSGKAKVVQRAFFANFEDAESNFSSSSANLDRIWDFCKYTMKATTPFGIFIDGNRERQAYEGDTYINQLGYLVCMADPEIPRDTIDRLFAYPTWPTEWRLAMIPIVHDYALYTGDLTNARRWYEPLKKSLLPDAVGKDGLLNAALLPDKPDCPGFGAKARIHDIVDWPVCELDNYEMGTVNLVPNCWHYMALRRMSALSELLGLHSEAVSCQNKAELSRAAIRRTMLRDGLFMDNPASRHTAIHSCIFPALWDIAEPAEKPRILALMKSKGMACSVFCAQFLLECCGVNRMMDYGLELMTSTGLRSWNNMLDKGATIAMEAWDDSFKPNQDWNHPWGAAPGNIIVRYLCGIRPLEPGFRKFTVDPQPAGLNHFELRTPSPNGPVLLRMESPERYVLTVPDGTAALFRGKSLPPGTHVLLP